MVTLMKEVNKEKTLPRERVEEWKDFIKKHAVHVHADNKSYTHWFACSDDQYPAIDELVKENFFKPLNTLVANKVANHWFVPVNFQVEDLPKIFTFWAINEFEIFHLNLDYQI